MPHIESGKLTGRRDLVGGADLEISYDDENRERLTLLSDRETTGGGTSVVAVNGTVHAMTRLGPLEHVTRKLISGDGDAKVIDDSPRRGQRLPEIECFMGCTPAQSDASSNTSAVSDFQTSSSSSSTSS